MTHPDRDALPDLAIDAAMACAMQAGQAPPAAFYTGKITDDVLSEGWSRIRRVRDWFLDRYSFAVPCAEAIAAISEHGPLLEVGAGTGLWAKILSHHVDVVATDLVAVKNRFNQKVGWWYPVQRAGAASAVKAHWDRTVLMVWPSYNSAWAANAAAAMRPGTVLAYIGEGEGGCTADDRFHSLLDRAFTEIGDVRIPQFSGMNDYLSLYRKEP